MLEGWQMETVNPFAEKCLRVFIAQGYTAADIEEAKAAIRAAWPDLAMRKLWVDWINEQAKEL